MPGLEGADIVVLRVNLCRSLFDENDYGRSLAEYTRLFTCLFQTSSLWLHERIGLCALLIVNAEGGRIYTKS